MCRGFALEITNRLWIVRTVYQYQPVNQGSRPITLRRRPRQGIARPTNQVPFRRPDS